MKPFETEDLLLRGETNDAVPNPFALKPALISTTVGLPVESRHSGCCSGQGGHRHGGNGCCGRHHPPAKSEKP